MTGLYLLLTPLKLIGFDVERFTARLILTLDYVEELAGKHNQKFHFQQLDDIYLATDNLPAEKTIVLESIPFSTLDKLMLAIVIIIPFSFMFLR
jgi:energy-coupling factor transport system permease protein